MLFFRGYTNAIAEKKKGEREDERKKEREKERERERKKDGSLSFRFVC